MFGRKRRPQEEDEPLVPHGLIWQATDDEPEQSADPAALVPPRVPSQPIEMPLRTDNRVPDQPVSPAPVSHASEPNPKPVDLNPGKLGNISPPMRWPSLKTASVIRRIEPAPPQPSVTDSKPAREVTPPQKLAPIARVPVQPIPEPQARLELSALKRPTESTARKVEIIELETRESPEAEKSQRREALARVIGSLRHRAGMVYGLTAKSAVHAGRKLQTAYAAINLRAPLERAKPVAEKSFRVAVAAAVSARQALKSLWTSNAPRMARVKYSLGDFSSSAMRSSLARSADLAQRVRSRRVRIRIVGSARGQALIQRGRLAWAARRSAVQRDPRLWTSLAMAALSALLTIGLISAVRPYSPGQNSSTKPSRAEQSPLQPASLIAPQTALASTRQTTKPRRNNSAELAPNKPSPVASQSKPNPVTRPAHRNSDEDYVAPNSYHYYGSRGKSR